jgi:hypothetical protein
MHGRKEKCIEDFGKKPGGKKPLGRPRGRWKNNGY